MAPQSFSRQTLLEQTVRMHLSRTQVENDRSALGGHPGGQGLVDFVGAWGQTELLVNE